MPAGHASKRARLTSGRERSTSQPGGASHLERELERSLREFVRLRTVSSDPTLREECFRGAKYLATLLESLGSAEGLLLLLSTSSALISGSEYSGSYQVVLIYNPESSGPEMSHNYILYQHGKASHSSTLTAQDQPFEGSHGSNLQLLTSTGKTKGYSLVAAGKACRSQGAGKQGVALCRCRDQSQQVDGGQEPDGAGQAGQKSRCAHSDFLWAL